MTVSIVRAIHSGGEIASTVRLFTELTLSAFTVTWKLGAFFGNLRATARYRLVAA